LTLRQSQLKRVLPWLLLALSLVGCIAGVARSAILLAPTDRILVDWTTYANAVDRFVSGHGLYAPQQLAGPYFLPDVVRIGYAYPPPSILLFAPFVSYPAGLIAWIVLNVGLVVTGLLAIVRKELGQVSPIAAAVILAGLALYVPFTEGVAAGNVNVALAGLFAWAWVIGRSKPIQGVLAGGAAVIKVVPGALVFWSDRRTFVRAAIIAAATAAAISVAALPLTGVHAWSDFLTALRDSQPNCSGQGVHASLACLIAPLTSPDAARWIVLGIALAAGIGALFATTDTVAFALVVLASVAPATDGHSHSLLVLFVLLVVLCACVVGRRSTVAGRVSSQPINGRPSESRSAEVAGL
jgi:hypothetical protein